MTTGTGTARQTLSLKKAGTLKWFDPNKGFGFIKPDDGGEDVFLHESELTIADLFNLPDGQRLRYRLGESRRGGQMAVAIEILAANAPTKLTVVGGSDHAPAKSGVVDWFSRKTGFGFIKPDEGGKDIFVHVSAVERAGLTGSLDGKRLGFDTEIGRNGGPQATNLKLL